MQGFITERIINFERIYILISDATIVFWTISRVIFLAKKPAPLFNVRNVIL